MAEGVVLDTSVLVPAFIQGDKFRPQAMVVLKKMFEGEYSPAASIFVPVETCGSISRRVGEKLASKAWTQLLKWEEIGLLTFVELTKKRKDAAVELAIELQMKGMDAISLQAAKEKGSTLITFDNELAEKARRVVKVLTHKDLTV